MQQPEFFYANYRGEVIRNDDPLEAGRVKIRVFGVYDDMEEPVIPWAQYSDPFMGGLANVGGIVVPEVESHVWVFFEGGNPEFPVYFAGAPAMTGGETPDIPEESRAEESNYPQNKVFRTKAGFIIEIDDSDDNTRLRIKQPSGNEKVDDHEGNVVENIEGNVEETVKGTLTELVEGNVDQTYNGTLTIDVEGQVIFRAPEMQFGEDGDVEQSVLGKQLEDFFNDVLKPYIDSHTHMGNLGSPTSPPMSPLVLSQTARGGSAWSKKNTNQ